MTGMEGQRKRIADLEAAAEKIEEDVNALKREWLDMDRRLTLVEGRLSHPTPKPEPPKPQGFWSRFKK